MISIEEIKKAREVIRDTVVHTPVVELELPEQKTNNAKTYSCQVPLK